MARTIKFNKEESNSEGKKVKRSKSFKKERKHIKQMIDAQLFNEVETETINY